MRYELTDLEPIAGIIAHSAAAGQNVAMIVEAFLTPDTEDFYAIIEQFDRFFLSAYVGSHSTIDHFLVVFRRDRTATVYVNDLIIRMSCIVKKPIAAGASVFKGDIAGIANVKLDVDVPPDAAVALYFTLGWRRGLYFDFFALQSERSPRKLERALARCYEKLWFAEAFSVPAAQWPAIFAAGWFPFIELLGGLFEELPSFLERDITAVWEEKVFVHFDVERLHGMVESWRTREYFAHHLPFLETGVERYLAGDYISAISNVWPRIEGILRFLYSGDENRPGQRKIVDTLRDMLETNELTPDVYFSELFQEYLLKVYYKDFDLAQRDLATSRHSIAHGVSVAQDYSRKKALLGFLIVHQLFYYVEMAKRRAHEEC